jgi:hypothetical protein
MYKFSDDVSAGQKTTGIKFGVIYAHFCVTDYEGP